MMVWSSEPAIACIALDIIVIPCRNKSSPPARPRSIVRSEKDGLSILKTTGRALFVNQRIEPGEQIHADEDRNGDFKVTRTLGFDQGE